MSTLPTWAMVWFTGRSVDSYVALDYQIDRERQADLFQNHGPSCVIHVVCVPVSDCHMAESGISDSPTVAHASSETLDTEETTVMRTVCIVLGSSSRYVGYLLKYRVLWHHTNYCPFLS